MPITYVRLRSIARTDMSNASVLSDECAYIRSLKALAVTDQSNLNLLEVSYLRGLKTSARTDGSNAKLKVVYRRSLRSKPARTDRSNSSAIFNRRCSLRSSAQIDSSNLRANLGAMQSIKAQTRTDQSNALISRMARKYLGFPPSGSIKVLVGTGETPLDRAQFNKGNTYALNVRVLDKRLAGYVITFEATANIPLPGGPKVIRLSSAPEEGGGLDDFVVSPAKSPDGSATQEWLAQGTLYSHETADLSGSVVFDWKLTYKIPCFGEAYQLASGQFIVT